MQDRAVTYLLRATAVRAVRGAVAVVARAGRPGRLRYEGERRVHDVAASKTPATRSFGPRARRAKSDGEDGGALEFDHGRSRLAGSPASPRRCSSPPSPRRLAAPVGGVDRLERRRPPAVAVPAPVAGARRRRDRAARRLRVLRDHAHGAANYFEGQKPMGDLQMLNFDCEAELGKASTSTRPPPPCAAHAAVVQVRAPAARPATRNFFHRGFPAPAGATARRGWRRLRTDNCTINRPDFSCPVCARTRRRRRRRRRPSTRSARRWARRRGLGDVAHISVPRSPAAGARAVLRGDDAAARSSSATPSSRPTAGPTRRSARTPPTGTSASAAASNGRVAQQPTAAGRSRRHPPHNASSTSALQARGCAPAAFELLTEKYAPPECGADDREGDGREQSADASRTWSQRRAAHRRPSSLISLLLLPLGARPRGFPPPFPAMCKAVRENACQGFCNDQCPAGSKKQVLGRGGGAEAAARRRPCRSPSRLGARLGCRSPPVAHSPVARPLHR